MNGWIMLKTYKKILFWAMDCLVVTFLGIALFPIVLISLIVNLCMSEHEIPRSSGWGGYN